MLHFTPVHTLRQLKRYEALIPPLRRVIVFRARYGWETPRMFWGWAKFEERGTHGWGKIALHTSSDLSRLVRTYAQYSDRVRLSGNVNFLHFGKILFFSLMSYLAEIAYFNSPNRELSNSLGLVELYWNRNVYSSSSPCLKAIDRKLRAR